MKIVNFFKYRLSINSKFLYLLAFIILLLIIFLLFDRSFLFIRNIDDLFLSIKILSKENFLVSIPIFISIYILATSLSLPIATFLSLSSGALFGWIGIPIVVFSATLGASIIFYLVQTSFGSFYINKVEKKFSYLEKEFKQDSFYFLLSLRLLPIAPFFLINILAGLFNINIKKYILATIIGILPASSVFVWIGKSASDIFTYSELPNLEQIFLKFIPPLFLMALISLLPIIFKRIKFFKSRQ